MSKSLSKKEAIDFLKLDEKLFDNFFKNAGEIPSLVRPNGTGRFAFDKDQLSAWKTSYDWRMIKLTSDDYLKCIDFALAMHFRGYVASDWGTGRQREFGQKIANWTRGQLGELAVKKFLQREFNIEVDLDFELREEIVNQDIIGVHENGKIREPKTSVGIKASKPKSSYLVLGDNEINFPLRRSEIYIFTRPDLPDDYLLRIASDIFKKRLNGQPHFEKYKDKIVTLDDVPCEVAGYCHIGELEKVTSIPGQEFENGPRHVKQSGKLYKTKEDWAKLVKKL